MDWVPVGEDSAMANSLQLSTCSRKSESSQLVPEVCRRIFDEFHEAQWKFCAKRLVHGWLNDTRLHEDEVVPFKRKEVLQEGPDSTILRVELFEEYNYLFPVGQISERA